MLEASEASGSFSVVGVVKKKKLSTPRGTRSLNSYDFDDPW
jgi:hypothetical protein